MEKETFNVVVDAGNFSTIARSKFGTCEIQTLLSTGNERLNNDAYIVYDYDGSDYVIGDKNKTVNTNLKLSKKDLVHKLTALTAIHAIVPDKASVNLYVGLPIKTHFNLDYRKEFIDYIKDDKLELNVNGVTKKINIVNVSTLPEGIGYAMKRKITKPTGIVDIGELTVDAYVTDESYSPIMSSVFTIPGSGARKLKTIIRNELNTALLDTPIQDYQMDYILKHGVEGVNRDKVKKIIYKCKHDFIIEIARSIMEHQWDTNNIDIIFTGGGALILKDVLEEFDGFYVSDTPLTDNIDGFFELVGE